MIPANTIIKSDIEIRRAEAKDFKAVYPLLMELKSEYTKERWQQLFKKPWDREGDYYGYIIFDRDKAVGYLGYILSKQVIDKKAHNFCNLTTWIVEKPYRGRSLSLLYPILKNKNMTITDLSPSPVVCKLLNRYHFKSLNTFSTGLACYIGLCSIFNSNKHLILNKNAIRENLDDRNLKIFNDHLPFNCTHLLLKDGDQYCYVITKKLRRKGLTYAQVHYISNTKVFWKLINKLASLLCWNLKVIALLIYEKDLPRQDLKNTFRFKLSAPHLFRSETLKESDISTLYSEIFILNI